MEYLIKFQQIKKLDTSKSTADSFHFYNNLVTRYVQYFWYFDLKIFANLMKIWKTLYLNIVNALGACNNLQLVVLMWNHKTVVRFEVEMFLASNFHLTLHDFVVFAPRIYHKLSFKFSAQLRYQSFLTTVSFPSLSWECNWSGSAIQLSAVIAS